MAPPSTADKFPTEDMFDALIRIEVGTGQEKRTFEVYKGVLCFYSGYFNTALNGRFIEAREYFVKLPTEDAKIFKMFVHWIHWRVFFEATIAPSTLLDFRTIADLWIFGDAHQVPMFQNEIVNVMVRKLEDSGNFPDLDNLTYICDNTIESSPLRITVSEAFHLSCGKELSWAELAHERPDTIFLGAKDRFFPWEWMEVTRKKLELLNWCCIGHVHGDGEECLQHDPSRHTT